MSTVKSNALQIGQSVTATNNFTWYQPASPDGTVRLGNGNSGSVSDVITVGTTGNLTFANSVSLTAASTKTLTLNGGGGTNGLVLDASNNVGIGAAPGAYRLDVFGNSRFYASNAGSNITVFGGGRTNDYVWLNGLGSPQALDGYTIFGLQAYSSLVSANTNVGTLQWAKEGSGTDNKSFFSIATNDGTTNAERFRVTSSGNLGLGVTPSAWNTSNSVRALQLNACSLWSYSTAYLFLGQNYYYNTSGNRVYSTTAPATEYQQSSGNHAWYTAPSGTAGNAISFTQAMTLDASGRLIVGNTSQLYGFSGRLYTEASSSSYLPLVALSSYSGDLSNPAGSFYKYDNNSTTSQVFVRFAINNGGAGCGQINGNGASAAAFGSFSDSRLKENITALPNQLANICNLKPCEFDYKDGSGHQIGFIAQEMQEVYPDVVGEGEDEMLTITGWSKTEARLVKAIQELSAELNELKQRIK